MRQGRDLAEDAGIADEDVEPAPTLVEGGAETVEGLVIVEVDRNERGADAHRANRVVELLERALRAGQGDHMRAGAGEGKGGGPPDAARGAGDDRDAIGERLVHGRFFPFAARVFHRHGRA